MDVPNTDGIRLYETREQAHAAYLEYKSSQIGEQK